MKHLSDEQILFLAETVVTGRHFSRDDELAMLHIANCQACYELLRCTMAVMEITNHIDEVVSMPVEKLAAEHSTAESSAIIKIVVLNVSAMLEQLRAETAEWIFDKPFALAGSRSFQDNCSDIQALEDIDNSESFVTYDPVTRTLAIQIDGQNLIDSPKAYLKYADGSTLDIVFENRANIYWAEVHDLNNGEYELILEK